ncbi:arginine--tRNA ligase [Propioniciclava sp. MC1595]|uniref:arginine--tRNA ligase n=1 Tax=Propioniciclava sp. MC1595 TaxID=2760308 RepID=UPI0016628AE5|nr:arginine--tRNA ligase [Propioniciclava sp. MC1595]MBB1495564.1 arginine--tRNA ligase [Propioniciclava sp. MC1595]QTE26747.1 arginine--tRNA ligase [Propioniciclava sp. MC1595]
MQSLASLLTARVEAAAGIDPEMRPATKPQFGHFQSNVALRLAKAEGRPPRDVAADLIGRIEVDDLCEPLEVAGPGFINFRIRASVLAQAATDLLGDPDTGITRAADPQTVVIDYSAPNVAKPMHVGNLRSTIIGDCFNRVLSACGHRVIPANHIGDWGTQFGMLVQFILDEGVDTASLDLDGSVALYKRAQERFKSDEQFADAARRRVVALQSGDEETLGIWRTLVEVSKKGFNEAYERLGVLLTDDDLYGESFYNAMLAEVAADLEQRGIAVVDDGALVVFVAGQEAPLIVRKSDGGFGYAATDLAAIRYRTTQLDADRIIYVVGMPQSFHFQQVFAVARMAGYLPEDVTAEHVGFGSVLGPDGKMLRTRAGGTVTLQSLLDEAEEVATRPIAMAAVKYSDLSNQLQKDYAFDAERMTATTGDTGPYLQYAHARANQILRRAEAEGITWEAVTTLTEPAEQALALQLSRFGEVVAGVAEDLQPHKLCTYLFETATHMSTFYEQCPVLKSEGDVRSSRLALCATTKKVLARGLELLGIEAPDQM